MDPSSLLVARVVPDVTGLDKEFDYLVPEVMYARIAVGSIVRMSLHGRSVRGWVVSLGPPDGSIAVDRLLPLVKWSGIGPSAEIIDLARWASQRWGAGRLRPFMVAGEPADDRCIVAVIRWSRVRRRLRHCAAAVVSPATYQRPDVGRRGGGGSRSCSGDSSFDRRGSPPGGTATSDGLLDGGASGAVGTCRLWGRRGDRGAERGMGAMRGHAVDRRARRTRRGVAGGAIADVARPRRRHRTCPTRTVFHACWFRHAHRPLHCSGPATRSDELLSPRSATGGRFSSSSIARGRNRGSAHC